MINKTKLINEAISSGVKFILKNQKSDGGFESRTYSEQSPANFTVHRTVFFPALITLCLSSIQTPESHAVKKRIRNFLLKNRSQNWTFNYWAKGTDRKKEPMLPDDLDDTACALSAISLNPDGLSGKALALAVKNLIACEKNHGGPYFTWLSNQPSAKTIDLAVNSNIAYFLSLHKAFPEKLHTFLEENIIQNNLYSQYYLGKLPVIYFISRSYKGGRKDKIIKNILSTRTTIPQDNSLILSSLLNLGYRSRYIDKLADSIIKAQRKDGSWPASDFGIEKITNSTKHLSSSVELTTAFCIQALSLYSSYKNSLLTNKEENFARRVKQSITGLIKSQSNPLRSNLNYLFRSLGQDIDEIILLPFWMNEIADSGRKMKNQTLQLFSKSSCWGWMAYRIFDDILDNQNNSALLPAANWSMLQATKGYCGFKSSGKVKNLFFQTMEKVELANTWEQKYGRIANVSGSLNFKILSPAQKSLGAAIAPLAVALGTKSKLFNSIEKFFINYLSARQLNDDAHDWEQDLKNGLLTPVTKTLLNHCKSPIIEVHALDINQLRKIFWKNTLPTVADKIQILLNKAEDSLNSIPASFYKNRLFQLLSPLQLAVNDALTQRKQTIEFLKYYRAETKTSRRDLVIRASRSNRKNSE